MTMIAAMERSGDHAEAGRDGLRLVQAMLVLVAVGLVLSGMTCFFLPAELDLATEMFERLHLTELPLLGQMYAFLLDTRAGVAVVAQAHPQLFLGTDYLAFAHFMFGILFLGAARDPVRNRWVVRFGIICCVLVVPYAFFFGWLRGAPLLHYFLDASFGLVAIVFLMIAERKIDGRERLGHRRGA